MMAVARPLVRMIFEFGLFGGEAAEATAGALTIFAAGMVGYGLQIILSRVCYALQDGRTPTVSAVASMAANAILCVVLVQYMSAINAAAVAGAVSITLAAAWMLIVLWRRKLIGRDNGIGESLDYVKMLLLAVLTYIAARICGSLFPDVSGMSLVMRGLGVAVPTAVGALVYLGGAWLLKIKWALH
jgi:putative peptidoglycan lipid II flippase